MAYIIVDENQTIIDLAVQLYGSAEAVDQLLELNPALTDSDPAWDISESLTQGSYINYDATAADKSVLKELDGKIIISE